MYGMGPPTWFGLANSTTSPGYLLGCLFPWRCSYNSPKLISQIRNKNLHKLLYWRNKQTRHNTTHLLRKTNTNTTHLLRKTKTKSTLQKKEGWAGLDSLTPKRRKSNPAIVLDGIISSNGGVICLIILNIFQQVHWLILDWMVLVDKLVGYLYHPFLERK